MLEETSKKGIYRGFDKKDKTIVDGITFSWGINHHGNGNTNFSGSAIFPSIGKLFHYLNIVLGRIEVFYKVPKFSIDKHVSCLSNNNPCQLHFAGNEGYDLFIELVMLEVAEQEEYRKDREEAGVPECITLKFAD